MTSNIAVISAFKSSNKKRDNKHHSYLVARLRELYRNSVSSFEKIYGEKPNTIYMSKFMAKCIVPNPSSLVKTHEDSAIYYCGIRVVYTKVNLLVAAICSIPETIEVNLKEINTSRYDLVKSIDVEYEKQA